uniref:hypothetical protein n=1 Tax=Nonomuraea sp. CA-251285 TaxID=3240002 RepID=UPI003F497AB1
MPARKKNPTQRPRTYNVGDRVSLGFGTIGRVTAVLRESNPGFFGYMVSINGGEPQRHQGAQVKEPPRPLLEEWRTWGDLAPHIVAGLNAERLAQLRMEYAEANPKLTSRYPHLIPDREPGVEPLHLVTWVKTTERWRTWSSNGAHERITNHHFWWVKCTCGDLRACAESVFQARRVKSDHLAETGSLVLDGD